MQEVLIFSGTSEGRTLAELLSRRGIFVTVCVATEYGQEVMEQENDYISVQVGRLTGAEMEALIGKKDWRAVVDATHPFAEEVTKNIAEACKKQGREVLRLLREDENIKSGSWEEETSSEENSSRPGQDTREETTKIIYVDSTQEAAAYLNQTAGNIFLTTGSKELPEYLDGIKDTTRIYVRILPSSQEVEKCRSLGLRGKQIICMQGPFSEALNVAMMKEIGADILVTKETARAGGFREKLAAAENVGADVVVIRRPKEKGYSLEKILEKLDVELPGKFLDRKSLFGQEESNRENFLAREHQVTAKIFSDNKSVGRQGGVAREREKQIIIAGMGMGSLSNMTGEVYTACENADVIIGAGRMLETVSSLNKPVKNLYKSREIADYIINHPQYQKIVVLMSGDVGFYSGAKGLRQAFQEAGITKAETKREQAQNPAETKYKETGTERNQAEIKREQAQNPAETEYKETGTERNPAETEQEQTQVQRNKYQILQLCGVSSVVYFASRLQISWEDITLMSSHGRQQNIIGMLNIHEKVFTLTDGAKGVRALSRELLDYGYENVKMYVGYQLSYEQEEIFSGTPEKFLDFAREGASVVLLIHEKAKETAVTHGISDELFVRGKVPMTKEEVRSISLSKLSLQRDSIVYDIGAGTGSVATECGRIAIKGKVYAVERKPEALELMEKNKYLHRAWNVETVAGEAPEVLEGLPAPTHVFIGGSGGNLKEILELLWKKSPHVRIVLNIISLDTLREVMEILKEHEFVKQEIVQVTVAKAKKLGSHQLMMGQNPVYVVTLQR